jgi:hypothetical protein
MPAAAAGRFDGAEVELHRSLAQGGPALERVLDLRP